VLFAVVLWLTGDLALAREGCAKASQLALALDTQAALVQFEVAIEQYFRALPEEPPMVEVGRCLIELGAAALDAGQSNVAALAFRRALVLYPALTLDASRYNPTTAKLFAKTRASFENSRVGALTLAGEPKGAAVLIDGERAGKLPLSLELRAGEHWILVQAPGHLPFQARVTIKDGEPARQDVFLRPREEQAASAPVAVAPREIVIAATQPVAEETASARPQTMKVHPVLAILPFGAAQFVERRPLAAALFLVSEVLLLGANIGTYVAASRLRSPDGTYDQPVTAEALKWVANAALIGLIAEMVGGAIDGLLHRERPAP
jgi:hypothetical protein